MQQDISIVRLNLESTEGVMDTAKLRRSYFLLQPTPVNCSDNRGLVWMYYTRFLLVDSAAFDALGDFF